uniref:Glucosamine/galactosamine-6-phosphate isomerase domain-containing protein n=1 Tax=Rhodosorus marinus TaxID=101924 RepID=A0A7S0G690_9RHOD|mmetsp:Transcript_4985/g.6957  ORF Transcript_4985/g.6957 Transcript_4985/m.6957 type:complete len:208 (+) Transcript_4985:119-742(+)
MGFVVSNSFTLRRLVQNNCRARSVTMQAEGSISLQISATKDVLSKQLAEFVIQKAAEAKKEKGKFVVALSGGSLPKTLAKDLVTDDYKIRAEFSSWHVYFADERCVPLDHEDSNYGLSKMELFDKVDIPADQVWTKRARSTVIPRVRPICSRMPFFFPRYTPLILLLPLKNVPVRMLNLWRLVLARELQYSVRSAITFLEKKRESIC